MTNYQDHMVIKLTPGLIVSKRDYEETNCSLKNKISLKST